jgi:hypothetical protein
MGTAITMVFERVGADKNRPCCLKQKRTVKGILSNTDLLSQDGFMVNPKNVYTV